MKVRIKEWADMAKEFGLDEDGNIDCYYGFAKDMREHCGEIIEVYQLFPIRGVFVYNGWVFSDEMYEVIEE